MFHVEHRRKEVKFDSPSRPLFHVEHFDTSEEYLSHVDPVMVRKRNMTGSNSMQSAKLNCSTWNMSDRQIP